MNTFAPFFLLSAALPTDSRAEAATKTTTLAAQLRAAGFAVDNVRGCYEGRIELALIAIPFASRMAGASLDVLRIAQQYGQESVLAVDANRNAVLVYCDGREPEQMGPFRTVSEWQARERDAWTERNGQYYVCGYQHERRATA